MQYSKQKPVVQESFGIGITKPDDIIISAEMAKTGVLFLRSDMPSFRQSGVPAFCQKEKIYHVNGKVLRNTIHTQVFSGTYVINIWIFRCTVLTADASFAKTGHPM